MLYRRLELTNYGPGWVNGPLFLPFTVDVHFMANCPSLRQQQRGTMELFYLHGCTF